LISHEAFEAQATIKKGSIEVEDDGLKGAQIGHAESVLRDPLASAAFWNRSASVQMLAGRLRRLV
jgi:hypothetical protein